MITAQLGITALVEGQRYRIATEKGVKCEGDYLCRCDPPSPWKPYNCFKNVIYFDGWITIDYVNVGLMLEDASIVSIEEIESNYEAVKATVKKLGPYKKASCHRCGKDYFFHSSNMRTICKDCYSNINRN